MSEQSNETPNATAVTQLPTPKSATSRPGHRVLACILCQQRKVKCDRKTPCGNCTRARTECIPATLATRRRRRRFPERELLDRLRTYESLLRQNNVKFEAFPKISSAGKDLSSGKDGSSITDDEIADAPASNWPSPSTTNRSDTVYRNMWRGMDSRAQNSDDDHSEYSRENVVVDEVVVTKLWDDLFQSNDQLLFGTRQTSVELSTLHPGPAQIFRLWQTYLENVNPLLKVTHTPTLQGRIVEAVSNVKNISPTMEALMFSIYCTAVISLAKEDVQTMFGIAKEDLLSRCQLGCRQALLNCGYLRSGERDSLTALYLYLISVRTRTVPRSLSATLGIAIRIAKRMGLHNDADLAKCTPLEAEMRRRLWWSLVLFDARVGEMADSKTSELVPTWDCRVPLNINDSDIRPEMKYLPPSPGMGQLTESLFTVVINEIGDFVRNSMFYIDFTSPALKIIARDNHIVNPESGEIATLELKIEERFLKSCDEQNPLHYMTIWTTRAFLAKYRLLEHQSRRSKIAGQESEADRDTGILLALNRIECDTKLTASPLTRGFLWLLNFHFPFPAFIHIVHDLRRSPTSKHANLAWEIMAANYEVRFEAEPKEDDPFFMIFAATILQAWEAREVAFEKLSEKLAPPRMVSSIRHHIERSAQRLQHRANEPPPPSAASKSDNLPTMIPPNTGSSQFGDNTDLQDVNAGMGPGVYHDLGPYDVSMSQWTWPGLNWNFMDAPSFREESYIPLWK